MKAVVAAFYQEKALGPSRGLLRDYESSDGPSFEALVIAENRGLITGRVMKPLQLLHTQLPAGGNTEVGGRDQKTIL